MSSKIHKGGCCDSSQGRDSGSMETPTKNEDESQVETSGESVVSEESVCSVVSEESVLSESSVSSESSVCSVSLYTHPEDNQTLPLSERINRERVARAELENNKRLAKLYDQLIGRVYRPSEEERMQQVWSMVEFLYYAVSPAVLLHFCKAYWELNQASFECTLQTHMADVETRLSQCQAKWMSSLPKDIKNELEGLDDAYLAAFRICSGLGNCGDPSEPGRFHLSYAELARRIGTLQRDAEKILSTYRAQGWLKIIERGSQYKQGQKPKATVYQWMLPIEKSEAEK